VSAPTRVYSGTSSLWMPYYTVLLQLSDETDLDLLNHSMEVMVQHFQSELLPVAAELTQRLVRSLLSETGLC
jgi:hypothetical protein